jgi:hypothetical protein
MLRKGKSENTEKCIHSNDNDDGKLRKKPTKCFNIDEEETTTKVS